MNPFFYSSPQPGQQGACAWFAKLNGAQFCLLQFLHLRMLSAKTRGPVALWLAAAVLLSGSGCAKIGEPQPPVVLLPKPAVDLAVRQVSDSVVLKVSEPNQNTNGSPATTFRKVEVLRLTESLNTGEILLPLPEYQFVKRADQVLLIPSSGFSSYLEEHAFVIPDKSLSSLGSPIYSHVFRYAVRFINNKNRAAGLSNQVDIAPVPIPPPPESLSAQVTEDFIRLNWTAPPENTDGSKPPRIAGYNIYRSEEPEKLSPVPLNREPVQKPEFEDRNFQFDKTYYYAVGTVGSLQNPYAESLPSKILPVVSRDVFPPAPPRDFNAILEGGIVRLLWAPSAAADVAGYRLYRQEKGASTQQLLQNELITAWSFRDNHVEPGKRYEYILHALDTHGNESVAVRTEVETR